MDKMFFAHLCAIIMVSISVGLLVVAGLYGNVISLGLAAGLSLASILLYLTGILLPPRCLK